jgi:hypothetical protein
MRDLDGCLAAEVKSCSMSRSFCSRLEGGFSAPRGIDTADTLGQMNLARAFLTFAIPPILFWAAS